MDNIENKKKTVKKNISADTKKVSTTKKKVIASTKKVTTTKKKVSTTKKADSTKKTASTSIKKVAKKNTSTENIVDAINENINLENKEAEILKNDFALDNKKIEVIDEIDEGKLEKTDEEEKDKKKKWLLILLLLFFFLFLFFRITYSINETFRDSINENIINTLKIDTPTSPRITGGSKEWSKKRVIEVVKDSISFSGIDYYEYCISEDKDFSNCEWKKTKTKNMVSSTTGKYYIVFRGVSNNGKIGSNSNVEETWIDNEGPVISGLTIDKIKDGVQISVDAKDVHSGIDNYYYKLDDGEYKNIENGKLIKLSETKEYEITIKAVDKLGNFKEVSKKFTYRNSDNLGSDENEQPSLSPGVNPDSTDDLIKPDDNLGSDDNVIPSPSPSVTPNPTDDPTTDDDLEYEEKVIPEINLDKVPAEFFYGESYELPSFVDFKGDTGTVSCVVEGKEYTDTSTLKIGKHLIVCNATSSKNVRVMVEKEVEVKVNVGSDIVWDGWITLNLYYPDNSTNWEWRIGKEGEIRTGYDNTGWQDYTGPILVKLEDVDDIYIRYNLNGETIVSPPNGKVLVDILPNEFILEGNAKTKVKIVYDEKAEVKEYRINGEEWKKYTGGFEVGANTLIEARVTKSEKVYDTNGEYIYTSKRTNTDSVFIGQLVDDNNTSGGANQGTVGGVSYQTTQRPNGMMLTSPRPGSRPSTYLVGPEITSNPSTEIVESTKVTITPQEEAEKIYYSVNNEKYSEYKGSFDVTNNHLIKAYYVRLSDGKVSEVSYYYVENIKKHNLPYVRINTSPSNYLSEDVNSVTVEITGKDYQTLQYSLDGVIYNNYVQPLVITESSTVYARATNQYGEKIESKTIVTENSPVPVEKLDVSIHFNPDKDNVEGLINKTTVSITYDSKADKKYYKVGFSDEWIEYTGEFEVNQNTTVYAYCTNENAKGTAAKHITFLTTGITNPIINADTTTNAPQLKVSITYDKTADMKKYQIGDGPLLDYNGEFYVYSNTTIRAYNKNVLGYEAESSLIINNIVPNPNYIVVDKGKYFILKLNYPEISNKNDREYKWKPDGVWKQYDEKGILLIKPLYKDEFKLDSADGVIVKDEDGKEVIFTDHYYLVDVPFSELMENLFMRWDKTKPKAPTILVDTEDATKKVEVNIVYPTNLVDKYYKVVGPDGDDTGWKNYIGSIEITKNNSVVYAKGLNVSEIESEIANKKITNIDEISPQLNVIGDLTTPKQKVTLKVSATDNLGVDQIKWEKGSKNVDYFKENGKAIPNNGTFSITENGKYTIYVSDSVGNEIIKEIEVTNIDKNSPNIIVNVLTEKYGTEAVINIDFADSKTKQYRIGESSTTYKTYTGNVTIKSNDVLNLANADGTLTIYAKGTDAAGNITEVSEKIYVLDLDAPATPVIYAASGYAIITEYGISLGNSNYIEYDSTRDDITNYYSVDSGKTWKLYSGSFVMSSGTIMAKSVKNESGLTVSVSKNVNMPTDSLATQAFDGKTNTYVESASTVKKMYLDVDPTVIGNNLKYIYLANGGGSSGLSTVQIDMLDKNNKVLSTFVNTEVVSTATTKYMKIVDGTKRILFTVSYGAGWGSKSQSRLYEVEVSTLPKISNTKYYPNLTEYGIEPSYNEVTINYYQTAVEKLYKINDGAWQTYTGKIRLEIGDVLTTQSANKYGTKLHVSTYTAALPADSIAQELYDKKTNTTVSTPFDKRINISSEMIGAIMTVSGNITSGGTVKVGFYNSQKQLIGTETTYTPTGAFTYNFTIPNGSIYAKVTSTNGSKCCTYPVYGTVSEVSISTKPKISNTKYYPNLTEYGVEPAYNNVTINYYQTAVQKLYKINSGEWQTYTGKIRLEIGDVITAQSIDKNGTKSQTSTYTAALPADSIPLELYDKKTNTTVSTPFDKRINISSGVYGKQMTISGSIKSGGTIKVGFYNSQKQLIGTETSYKPTGAFTNTFSIPSGSTYAIISSTSGSQCCFYEVPGTVSEVSVKPLSTKTTLKVPRPVANPSISVDNKDWATSKTIKIDYPSGYVNEYSLDNGNTWNTYTGEFTITKPTTVFARVVQNEKVISSSSFTVTKIEEETNISLEIPDKILVGSDISLPTNVTGGISMCTVNEQKITNISELEVGIHTLICTVTSSTGNKKTVTKEVEIFNDINPPVIEENTEVESSGE